MTFPQSYRARLLALGGAALAAAAILVAVLALTASAHGTTDHHGGAVAVANGSVGSNHERIAVDDHGRAIYVLSPETTHHRLCTMANGCFSVWPPLTAHGAVPAHIAGLSGTVTTTTGHQLALNGHPLYLYAGDRSRDVAHGDGVKSFGGTWHVVAGTDAHHTSHSTTSGSGAASGSSGSSSGSGSGGGW